MPMLGWMIIFASLSLLGLGLGQSQQTSTVAAGYGLSVLFGSLFAFLVLIRRFTRHTS